MRVSGEGEGVLEKVREEWCQCLIRPGLDESKWGGGVGEGAGGVVPVSHQAWPR